jgi:hypothetical protein
MARRCPKLSRHTAVLGLGVLVILGSARSVRAQGHTPDPYNGVGEYNIGYRDYLDATYPNGFGVSPNQGVLSVSSGVARANQFQSYIESLEGLEQGPAEHEVPSTRGVGPGVPYYRANRRYDKQLFNRTYRPNEWADQAFLRDRQARDQKYVEYLRETDPKRRAQLYREYSQENLRAARDLAQPRGGGARAATAPGTTTPPPPPSSRAATAPPRAIVPPPGSNANSPSMLRPSPSAVFPGRSTGSAPPPPGASRLPRTGSAPPSPAGGLTPSEVLRRSEPLDRENRANVPLLPPNR